MGDAPDRLRGDWFASRISHRALRRCDDARIDSFGPPGRTYTTLIVGPISN